jgi:ribosomal protein S15P/S13E
MYTATTQLLTLMARRPPLLVDLLPFSTSVEELSPCQDLLFSSSTWVTEMAQRYRLIANYESHAIWNEQAYECKEHLLSAAPLDKKGLTSKAANWRCHLSAYSRKGNYVTRLLISIRRRSSTRYTSRSGNRPAKFTYSNLQVRGKLHKHEGGNRIL